jgi:hypothetical protein
MKTLLSCIAIFFVVMSAHAQTVVDINLTANVDGLSDILISPTGFQWEHYQAQAPGLQGGDFPTNITVTVGGNTALDTSWFPDWDNQTTVLAGGSPPIFSSELATDTAEPQYDIAGSENLTVLQSRGSITMLQTPNATNGNTFDIQFNDIGTPGSADYQFDLSYTVSQSVSSVPEPSFYGLIFSILSLLGAAWKRKSKSL